jgi:DNA-binding XRE family transcriptional regulator
MSEHTATLEEKIRQIVRDEFAILAAHPKPLREWRKAAKLTQRRLADLSGTSESAIKNFEKGVNVIRSTREKVARTLGVKVGDIA